MMQIGHRFGNAIWIDWKTMENGEVIPVFQQFDKIEEFYDAWAGFLAMAVRAKSNEDQSIFAKLYMDAESYYLDEKLSGGIRQQLEADLGIRSPIDQLNYGRSLLNKEFNDF